MQVWAWSNVHLHVYYFLLKLKRENRKIEILLHDMDFVAGVNVACKF